MLVMNCLDEENTAIVGGNHFKFAPKQIKHIYNNDIGNVIVRVKAEQGFVSLPDDLEYLCHLRPGETQESRILPEHTDIIASKREEGVNNYVLHLNAMVRNAQISLARDLAQKNYKHDVKFEYSDGDIKNMEMLVKYRGKKEDSLKNKVDKASELEKKLNSSR